MRHISKKLRWAVALAIAGLLTACGGKSAEVYPIAPQDMAARLQAVQVPMFMFGTGGAMADSPAASVDGPNQVSWPIRQGSDELFRYVATIEPAGENQSSVRVSILPGNARVAQGLKDNPDIGELYEVAMIEAIDSTLEGREFSMAAIGPATMAAAQKRMGEINAKFDREIEQHRKKTQDNLERAYREQGLQY